MKPFVHISFIPNFFEKYARCLSVGQICVLGLILERGKGEPVPLKHRALATVIGLPIDKTKEALDALIERKLIERQRRDRKLYYRVLPEGFEALEPRKVVERITLAKAYHLPYHLPSFGSIFTRFKLAKSAQLEFEFEDREFVITKATPGEARKVVERMAQEERAKSNGAQKRVADHHEKRAKEYEAFAALLARHEGEDTTVDRILRTERKNAQAQIA